MAEEDNVYMAKLAEQAERYDEMVQYMKTVAESKSVDLTLEERACGVRNAVEIVREAGKAQPGVRHELLETVARLGLQLAAQLGLDRREACLEHLCRSPLLDQLEQLLRAARLREQLAEQLDAAEFLVVLGVRIALKALQPPATSRSKSKHLGDRASLPVLPVAPLAGLRRRARRERALDELLLRERRAGPAVPRRR